MQVPGGRGESPNLSDEARDLVHCLEEQRRCRAYLDGPGLDKAGAWQGVCDWMMEECIIRLEMAQRRGAPEGAPKMEDVACVPEEAGGGGQSRRPRRSNVNQPMSLTD